MGIHSIRGNQSTNLQSGTETSCELRNIDQEE